MANGTIPPELVGLWNIILSGVKSVQYGDRRIDYASIGDLQKAISIGLLPLGGGVPRRRGACFSKGLDTGYGPWAGTIEHQEIPGVDVLFSRGAPVDPTRTDDVDWERAR